MASQSTNQGNGLNFAVKCMLNLSTCDPMQFQILINFFFCLLPWYSWIDCAYARIIMHFVNFDFIGTIIIIIVLYGIIFPYINNVVLCQFC